MLIYNDTSFSIMIKEDSFRKLLKLYFTQNIFLLLMFEIICSATKVQTKWLSDTSNIPEVKVLQNSSFHVKLPLLNLRILHICNNNFVQQSHIDGTIRFTRKYLALHYLLLYNITTTPFLVNQYERITSNYKQEFVKLYLI